MSASGKRTRGKEELSVGWWEGRYLLSKIQQDGTGFKYSDGFSVRTMRIDNGRNFAMRSNLITKKGTEHKQ